MSDAHRESDKEKQPRAVPTVSRILPDGTLIELLYHHEEHRTLFALYSAGRWTMQHHIDIDDKRRLIPFSPDNNLIRNEVVLLPSEPRIYGTEGVLVAEVQSFVHRYVDLSPIFEKVAVYYIL